MGAFCDMVDRAADEYAKRVVRDRGFAERADSLSDRMQRQHGWAAASGHYDTSRNLTLVWGSLEVVLHDVGYNLYHDQYLITRCATEDEVVHELLARAEDPWEIYDRITERTRPYNLIRDTRHHFIEVSK